MLKVKALLFDVFGTVVDWRTGIAKEVESVAKKNDISLDPFDFADAWRAEYQPAMEEIRKGRRSFTILDILHMENLKKIASKFNLHNLSDEDFVVEQNTRLFQLCGPILEPVSFQLVSELSETTRGEGGLGSTGN